MKWDDLTEEEQLDLAWTAFDTDVPPLPTRLTRKDLATKKGSAKGWFEVAEGILEEFNGGARYNYQTEECHEAVKQRIQEIIARRAGAAGRYAPPTESPDDEPDWKRYNFKSEKAYRDFCESYPSRTYDD